MATADPALRDVEPDRYLSLLFAPAGLRDDLAALYAFDHEAGSVRERAREPLTAQMRLQWWQDALLAGRPTGHPAADALIAAIERHRLPVPAFERYLEGRLFDVYDDPMPDRAALEAYCGETTATIHQLGCIVLAGREAESCAEAAGHAGCADGITRLIWSMARQRARGQCYVPADMLSAAGTSVEEFLSAAPGEGAARAAGMMVALARDHLAAFRRAVARVPHAALPAFLPIAVIEARLSAAGRLGAGLLAGPPAVSPLRLQGAIWRRALLGWGRAA